MSTPNLFAFRPRANLRRTLSYRFFVRLPYYASLFLQAAYTLFVIFQLFSRHESGETWQEAFHVEEWGLLIVWVVMVHHWLRPLAKTKVHVSREGLTIEKASQKIEMPFQEITHLTLSNRLFSKILLPGSFSLKTRSAGDYHFSIGLERCEYILEAIAAHRPDLVEMHQLMEFRRHALVMDHGWARQKDSVKKTPLLIALKYLFFPLAETLVLLFALSFRETTETQPYFLATFLYFLFAAFGIGLPINGIKSLVMARKEMRDLKESPTAVIRDLVYEQAVNRKFDCWYWGASLAFFIFLMILKLR